MPQRSLRELALTAVAVLGLGGLACGNGRTVSGIASTAVVECTQCHGGLDNQTGAPPLDVSGRSDPSLPSVGAHTAHVQSGTASLAGAFDCDACHPKPATVDAPGHMDGTVQIKFGPLATASGALSPAYDARTNGCATVYCHGAFPFGNAANVPVWTAGSSQAACGTCHGDPAAVPSALPGAHARLASGSTNATCSVCHPETVRADGTIDLAGGKHVDGLPQVDPEAVHPAGWLDPSSPQFHAAAAAAAAPSYAACLRCHAANAPANVTTIVCNGCHGLIGSPIVPTP
jgi:predicted CxxxxCH...CXXCH cytochrome family protein